MVKKKRVTKKRPVKKPVVHKRKRTLKPKKKITVKRTAPKVKKAKTKRGGPKQKILGMVTHYFPKVRAAVIKLKAPLSAGDTIKIKGHTTDFTQAVSSMQIDHVDIAQAKKGQEIGLLVNSRVRQHDTVYKA